MEKLYLNPHVLVIVTGIAGSGKTTLSTGYDYNEVRTGPGVINHFHMAYIDKDSIADGYTAERSGEFYEGTVRPTAYRIIYNEARDNLMGGISVLVNAQHSTEVQNEGWADRYRILTEETHSKLKLIRCVAPEELIRQRLEERGYERDWGKFKDWGGFVKNHPSEMGGMISVASLSGGF